MAESLGIALAEYRGRPLARECYVAGPATVNESAVFTERFSDLLDPMSMDLSWQGVSDWSTRLTFLCQSETLMQTKGGSFTYRISNCGTRLYGERDLPYSALRIMSIFQLIGGRGGTSSTSGVLLDTTT
jgi:hypothetical protein